MPPRPCSSDTAAHGGEWGGKYRGRFSLTLGMWYLDLSICFGFAWCDIDFLLTAHPVVATGGLTTEKNIDKIDTVFVEKDAKREKRTYR